MSLETRLHDQLRHLTDDVPGGPDLATSVRAGRTRRRLRTAAWTGGAALGAAAVVSLALVLPRPGGDAAQPATQVPSASAGQPTGLAGTASATPTPGPADTDFIPGTDRDENLVAVITRHVSGLPTPDDVYPSDVHTAGPIPDSAYARATDFQATYTLGDHDQLVVFTGYSPTDESVGPRGRVTTQVSTSDGDEFHLVDYTFTDGFTVSAYEVVTPGQHTTADQAALRGLVQDAALKFPAPAGVPVHP